MNLGNSFLIKFLMILFSLEGSMSMNDKILGYRGNQIILSGPKNSTRPHYLRWTKNSRFIADYSDDNKTIISEKSEPNKYQICLNGSLKINRLKTMDAGNYKVEAHGKNGKKLFHGLITLQVIELEPKLSELCPRRTLTCEVKSSEESEPRFKLFQDTKEMEKFLQPVYNNATWKVTLQLKVLSGKFRCEIDVNSEKSHTEKQITCPALLHSQSVFVILIIMGSVVTSIIFLALIIYCIIKKKAKRSEREAEEYALQIQIKNHMQQRKLPDIPASSGSKSRSSPYELPQQIGPSKSCPHPKPPRRTKEIP